MSSTMMIDLETGAEHERVVLCSDVSCGYRAVIAMHSTRRGPAIGGTRFLTYHDDRDAERDALHLSRAMTYKAALANLPFGGGKAVVFKPDATHSRAAIMRAHGRAIEALGGMYITAMDSGLVAADLEFIHEETDYVSVHTKTGGGNGDDTARGVERAMLAAVSWKDARENLLGLRVAIQGCGNVGSALAFRLRAAGAILFVSDIDESRARNVARHTGASFAHAEAIHTVDVDVFAPCALGGSLTEAVVGSTTATVVAGGANNQLSHPKIADALTRRGITYVPDFVANAGGLIAGAGEQTGITLEQIIAGIDAIRETSARVLAIANQDRVTTVRAAEKLAEHALQGHSTFH